MKPGSPNSDVHSNLVQSALISIESSLSQLLNAFARAWQAGDCKAIIRLMSPDAVWVNPHGEYYRGLTQVTEHLRGTLCPPFDPDVSEEQARRMHAVATRTIGENVVSVQLLAEGRTQHRSISLVCERISASWRIGHCMIGGFR